MSDTTYVRGTLNGRECNLPETLSVRALRFFGVKEAATITVYVPHDDGPQKHTLKGNDFVTIVPGTVVNAIRTGNA